MRYKTLRKIPKLTPMVRLETAPTMGCRIVVEAIGKCFGIVFGNRFIEGCPLIANRFNFGLGEVFRRIGDLETSFGTAVN